MNVCVVGAGYVGLTTAAVLSDLGHHVTCIDKDEKKINALHQGIIPIFEPGLEQLVIRNRQRLQFTDDLPSGIVGADVVMVAVGTPPLPDGSSNLSYLYAAIFELINHVSTHKTIIIKSTVPPGTNEAVYKALIAKGYDSSKFTLVSNPEFLREGSAVYDMLHPDRIVIGLHEKNEAAITQMEELYKGIKTDYIVTNYSGAELIKYGSNAFLATKISFINEMARICESFEADITDVARGIGSDARIGHSFLHAGIGYGGSCFPKDLQSLSYVAKSKRIDTRILDAAQAVNATQVDVYVDKIQTVFPHISSMNIAVLGISFKPNTDDIRESRAVELIRRLRKLGSTVHAYDPEAELPPDVKGEIKQYSTAMEALKDVDMVIVATEWPQFIDLDWTDVKRQMKGDAIVDARNCLEGQRLRDLGFQYIGVGRL